VRIILKKSSQPGVGIRGVRGVRGVKGVRGVRNFPCCKVQKEFSEKIL